MATARSARSARSLVRGAYARAQSTWRAARGAESFWDLPTDQAVRMAYNTILLREPDDWGFENFRGRLDAGTLTRAEMLNELYASTERRRYTPMPLLGFSLHAGRSAFVQSLPKAARILDLGGVDTYSDDGAFVALGYPYDFDELVIVDLPSDDRHPLYQTAARPTEVRSPLGPVRYRYHSMTDLSGIPDASVDLVYSGQTIEHVPEADADTVLREARRVLRPGGHLALDTPNARVTRLQQHDFIDPDHKVEYVHEQMVEKFTRAGLEVVEAKGINWAGPSLDQGEFVEALVAQRSGLFADITACYLLAYVCRRPA